MHEIEILGRNLTWTEEGLEYEGSDKHRRALLEGLGLNEESKAVNSAAVKPEEIGQEEDKEMLDASEAFFQEIQKFGGDVELHELLIFFFEIFAIWCWFFFLFFHFFHVQYAAKEVCKMIFWFWGSPTFKTQGSWKMVLAEEGSNFFFFSVFSGDF